MTKTVLLKENEFIIEVHPDGLRARNPHKPDNKSFISLVHSLKVVDDVMAEVRKNAELMMKKSSQTAGTVLPETVETVLPETGEPITQPPDDSPPLPSTSSDPNPFSEQQESSLPQ